MMYCEATSFLRIIQTFPQNYVSTPDRIGLKEINFASGNKERVSEFDVFQATLSF